VWTKIAASILALGTGVAATGACAMSAPQPTRGPCRVIGGEKLPAEAGGADAICAAVQRAVAARAPGVRYSAEVRVLSRNGLAANLETNGRKLPELRFSVQDRELNSLAIGHFADSVASALADAGRR
jgi:hypothetical protein